jgi:hypothetical protein
MDPTEKRVLDILAQSPDGATEEMLKDQGIDSEVMTRLVYAGLVREAVELFTRPRRTRSSRFYITAAGRTARLSNLGQAGCAPYLREAALRAANEPKRSSRAAIDVRARTIAIASVVVVLLAVALVAWWAGLVHAGQLSLPFF